MLLSPPNLLPLSLEAQAPGEPWGHFGTVPVTIPSGRETLRASLCVCVSVVCCGSV